MQLFDLACRITFSKFVTRFLPLLYSNLKLIAGEFQVRIPVIVVGELEGLIKIKDHESSSPEHAATVREASKAALSWIREKHPNVKCVTTKGENGSALDPH
jgi:hypothetical protein